MLNNRKKWAVDQVKNNWRIRKRLPRITALLFSTGHEDPYEMLGEREIIVINNYDEIGREHPNRKRFIEKGY